MGSRLVDSYIIGQVRLQCILLSFVECLYDPSEHYKCIKHFCICMIMIQKTCLWIWMLKFSGFQTGAIHIVGDYGLGSYAIHDFSRFVFIVGDYEWNICYTQTPIIY